MRWYVAIRPSLRRTSDKNKPVGALIDQLERTKARIRAKVEHPFRILKQQFGYVKVRYRGLRKNTAQIITLFALSNLWMARHKLLAMGQVRSQQAWSLQLGCWESTEQSHGYGCAKYFARRKRLSDALDALEAQLRRIRTERFPR